MLLSIWKKWWHGKCVIKRRHTTLRGKISLLFNIMSVFDKNIAVKKYWSKTDTRIFTLMQKGKTIIISGKANRIHLLESSSVNVQLISLVNMRVRYLNEHDNQDYLFTSKNQFLAENFPMKFTLNTNAKLHVSHLFINNVNYVADKPVIIHSACR